MSEYNFNKTLNNKNKILNLKNKLKLSEENNENNLKNKILKFFDIFNNLKTSNVEVQRLFDKVNILSQKIVLKVNDLQSLTNNDLSIKSEIVNNIKILNDEHNYYKTQLDNKIKFELTELCENYPELYDKFVDGIDRETLEHVLNVIEEQRNGFITSETAINIGVNYSTSKYKLPKDFFDKNTINTMINNSKDL
jgi:hypothetical protein